MFFALWLYGCNSTVLPESRLEDYCGQEVIATATNDEDIFVVYAKDYHDSTRWAKISVSKEQFVRFKEKKTVICD